MKRSVWIHLRANRPGAALLRAPMALVAFLMTLHIAVEMPFTLKDGSAIAAVTIENSVPVTSVSAASYVGQESPLAPGSIVAAFGTQLATGTLVAPSQPLPTSLLTSSVTVNGVAAPLFFVSSNQINYQLPPGTAAGEATVVVRSTQTNGDVIVSTGTVRVAPTAPSIFTANSNGSGVPAALTGRINVSGVFVYDPDPPFAPDPVNPGLLVPSPIDVGTAERPAFLILYGTGIRNVTANQVSVVIGGVVSGIEYVGPHSVYAGLDQINLLIPPSLKGSGQVEVTIVVDGVSSNSVTINLAGATSSTLAVSGFSATSPVVAGETVTISGSGFSTTASQNVVRFGAAQARVVAATTNELTVIVPFGAESGRVVVQTNNFEARSSGVFLVRTSISGMVQSTGTATSDPVALNNVTVRLSGTNTSVRTSPQGTFVLSNIPAGVALVEVDGGTSGANPPFPSVILKVPAKADRDNQVVQPISLQQISGGSGNVGTAMAGSSGAAITSMSSRNPGEELGLRAARPAGSEQLGVREQLTPRVSTTLITNRGVSLEVPLTTTVRFPDGSLRGTVQVTLIERSRLPGIVLPTGIFSTNIAQITPISASFSPGASITFPNPDPNSIGPGTRIDIYRYDSGSGGFIRRGTGTVSANRLQVVSDGRIVDTGGFWMAAVSGRVTTVTGRLIDSFGDPVAGGKVTANGRAATSDQNGGFSLADVPAISGNSIQVEAVLPQQYGTPPRGLSPQTPPARIGITEIGTIALSETNQPGLVMSPFALNISQATKTVNINITLTQPAPTSGLGISLTSSNQQVVRVPSQVTIAAGRTTSSFIVNTGTAGNALVEAKASLQGTTIDGATTISVTQPGPVLTSISAPSGAEGAIISLFGTGLASTSIRNYVTFRRNGQLLTFLPPSDVQVFRDSSGQPSLRIRIPKVGPGAASIQVAVVDGATGVLSDPSAPLNFTVVQKVVPAPKLTSLTPSDGAPRDQITINGSGFSPTIKLNRVIFTPTGQTGTTLLSYEGEIVQAGSSSLVVTVPASGLQLGRVRIVARVLDENGVESTDSNALDFIVVKESVDPPPNPSILRISSRSTGADSGKEGDLLLVSGSNFGPGWFNVDAETFSGKGSVITIFRFYQGTRLVNTTFPVSESSGISTTTVVPSGLQKGTAQVAAINYDQQTGRSSEESKPINFTITEGSPLRLREAEPNNLIEQATEVIFPSIIEGDIASGEPGELIYVSAAGDKLPVSDLYRLNLTSR
ncbi:MAG: hypothetical protein EBZ36_05030, partial [Acidobacteria bacterium]|nr:hypothetical protein [Acidobacteriota bacterium]